MIQEFEQLLARGGGPEQLERMRQQLRSRADDERLTRLDEIERDVKTCQLILYGLSQNRNSPPYSMARGLINWYRKKHPANDSLAREIMRSVRYENYLEQKRKEKSDDGEEGKQANITRCGDDRSGEGMPTAVPKSLPQEEPGSGTAMEL